MYLTGKFENGGFSSSVIVVHPLGHLMMIPGSLGKGKSVNMVFQQAKNPPPDQNLTIGSEQTRPAVSSVAKHHHVGVGDVDFKGKPFMSNSSIPLPSLSDTLQAGHTATKGQSWSAADLNGVSGVSVSGVPVEVSKPVSVEALAGKPTVVGVSPVPTITGRSVVQNKVTADSKGQSQATVSAAGSKQCDTQSKPLSFESRFTATMETAVGAASFGKLKNGVQLWTDSSEYTGKFEVDRNLNCTVCF